jgi:hypothetical protein
MYLWVHCDVWEDYLSDLAMFLTISTGLMDTMKQADQSNWCLNHEQFADLASSLSTFFNQSGLLPTVTPPTTTSKYTVHYIDMAPKSPLLLSQVSTLYTT